MALITGASVLNPIDDITLAIKGNVYADDNVVDINDMSEVINILYGINEYTAVADVDNDGDVDFADYAAIAKFANSNKTIADYYAMFGYDFAAAIEAYECSDYDLDGDVDAVDVKAFKEFANMVIALPWNVAEIGTVESVLDAIDEIL